MTSNDHLKYRPWLVRNTARFIFIYLLGWQLKGDLHQFKKAVIIGVPHTSNWDAIPVFLASLTLGVNFRWMGKHTLFRLPLAPLSYWLGGIPIDRSSRQNAVEQMIAHIQQSDTVFVGVAPEGTRKRAPHWKTGFYHIAIGAKVPIVCAKIDWGRKTIDVESSLMPSGDIEADLEIIRGIYKDVVGKRPENFGEIILPPERSNGSPMNRRHFLASLLVGSLGWRFASPRVEAFLSQMDLAQKAGQICLFSLAGESYNTAMHRLIAEQHAGGMVLFGYNVSNPTQLTALTNTMQQNALSNGLPIPLFIGADQEGGRVLRLRGAEFSPFPSPMALGAADSPPLTEQMAKAIAQEMGACGLNLNLAPVLDVNTTPANPVINIRAFGSDPKKVAAQGVAFIEGLQKVGIIATGKHFPGHGSTQEDSHYALPVVTLDHEQLMAEMQPFSAAIQAQVGMMMTAHVVYNGLDNAPATFSAPIITDLLQGELGFNGVVISDALTMGAVSQARDNPAYVLRDALLAGVDMLAYGALPNGAAPSLEEQIRLVGMVAELVESGLITPARLDASVRKVLTLKEQFGLLDWQPATTAQLDTSAHLELLELAAQKSVTLFRDENHLIPLAPDAELVVLFPAESPQWAEHFPLARPLPYALDPSAREIRQIRNQITNQTVICLTADTFLHPAQVDLVNALPLERTLVIAVQSPYDLLKFPLVGTYLMTYGYTPQAFAVVVDILKGDLTAQGKAPISLV